MHSKLPDKVIPDESDPQEIKIHKATMGTLSYTENSSPFPSAENLDAYEKHCPGTMKFLLDKYGEEQTHRHELEKNESNANIKAIQTEYDLENEDQKIGFIGNTLGQILSTVICLSSLGATCYLAMAGHTVEAVAAVSIPFAGIIRAIMKK